MKFRTVMKKTIVILMAIVMTIGICAPSVSAAIPPRPSSDNNGDGVINYVSFGDSMTNGYGLDGYNGNCGVFDYGYTSYANQFAAYLAGANYKNWVNGGFKGEGLVFRGTKGVVNHHQLAMSGCRAEDLHWLLEFDFSEEAMALANAGSEAKGSGYGWREFYNTYEEDWYNTFSAGDMRTFTDLCNCDDRCTMAATYILASGYESPYATKEQIEAAKQNVQLIPNSESVGQYATWGNHVPIVAEYYQRAVKDADVISLALGNTNFGTFIFNEIYNSVNGDDKPLYFRVERAIEELSPEMQELVLKLRDELYVLAEDYLGEDLSYELPENGEEVSVYDTLANTLVYGFISYFINYAGSVEAILALNPDVEIIQVGLMNAYGGDSTAEVEGATIGDLLGTLYPVVNAYLAALPTIMRIQGNELYNQAKFYYAETESVACMVEVYGNDFYYNEDGDLIDYDDKDNYEQGTLTCNRNSLIRKRFFKDVMGTVRMMHGSSFNGITLDYSITLADVLNYDEMSTQEQSDYAAVNSAKALTIAVYLAYEEAHIIAGKESPVTIEAIMGLGDIKRPEMVETILMDLLATNAPAFAVNAATSISNLLNYKVNTSNTGFKADTNYNHILAVYTGKTSAYEVGLSIAKSDLNKDIIEHLAREGVYARLTDDTYAYYYAQFAAANNLPYTWDQFKQYGGNSYTAFVEGVKANAWATYKDTALATAYDEAAKTLAPHVQSAAGNVTSLCTLLALTDAFSYALCADPTSNSLLCLNARTQVGTGLGGHPAPQGHDDLFNAVKTSYRKYYMSSIETLKNSVEVLKILNELRIEYGDEIYDYVSAEVAKKAEEAYNQIVSDITEYKNALVDKAEESINNAKAQANDFISSVISSVIENVVEHYTANIDWSEITDIAIDYAKDHYDVQDEPTTEEIDTTDVVEAPADDNIASVDEAADTSIEEPAQDTAEPVVKKTNKTPTIENLSASPEASEQKADDNSKAGCGSTFIGGLSVMIITSSIAAIVFKKKKGSI